MHADVPLFFVSQHNFFDLLHQPLEVRMNRGPHLVGRRLGAIKLLIYVCPFIVDMMQVSIRLVRVYIHLEEVT
eukprot:8004795-Pyramimonas_sp.AAC.1